MGYYYYIIFMLPAFILTMICQIVVRSTFSKYSKVANHRGITGAQAAHRVLITGYNGVTAYGVNITSVNGSLTDHFDPKANEIRLSQPVHGSSSIASVGVAAHEAGHALQYASEYSFIKLRTAIIPICNLGARFAPLLIIFGLIFASAELYLVGIIGFCAIVFFQLVTLPVEFNASKRAISAIRESGILDEEELKGAKKVLTAAALTYVAALFTSMLQLFYYIQLGRRGRD